ncbi:MAG TPA: glutamate-1-semialdehyde 2,1-aminomutase [Anaerovoracaceae bacterium]|nr:glutamate-1-semialdehyde 2,1-aminomutase [Anaerovoracaceae bacterium]
MDKSKSSKLFSTAREYMPGGVNSPVRAFKSVGLTPLFIKQAQGSKITDVDDNQYIDYVCSWGPLILGHSHPQVITAICTAAKSGTSYGAPCESEIELAKLICEAFPAIDKIRMVNSGTEATMSAVRLARAYTQKDKIIKFEGCYHGHADSFLIKAGSGLLTSGIPTSPGVPQDYARNTLIAKYNDIDSVASLFAEYGEEIAAVIVEPVAGNMGLVLPDIEFLKGLRKLTEDNKSLLIFDEVISGFRTCYGGYQNRIGVFPDLTTLGKIIGGGLPVGAYGGKKEIMDMVAPEGDVYQAGTLSGNPLAMAAGIATLNILKDVECYSKLEQSGEKLAKGITQVLNANKMTCTINRLGSMFSIFFTKPTVRTYDAVIKADTKKYAQFYSELLNQGVYFPPAQFEVCFISLAHKTEDIERTIDAIDKAFSAIQ